MIASLKRNLSSSPGQDYTQWQAEKLRDIKRYQKENRRILLQYDSNYRRTMIEIITDTYKEAWERTRSMLAKRDPSGIYLKQFETNDNKIHALLKTFNEDMATINPATAARMSGIYREIVFKAQLPYGMGATTLPQAIDAATRGFLSKGVDSITYNNGNRVNIASYAEMSLRTTNHRSYLMGEGQAREELGETLVVVSAHATSCKLCGPWQGRVLIDDVYSGGKPSDGKYSLLSDAMGEGLLHPNCRHNLSTYYEGITTPPTVPRKAGVDANYIAQQRQREIERNIVKYKRLEAGSMDSVNIAAHGDKVKEWQRIMRDHLKENDQLRRSYRREKLYG